MRPTFLVEDKEAINLAKKKALEALGPELVHRLRSLHAGLTVASNADNRPRPTAPNFPPPTARSPRDR